jgi:hypothetical protein
MSMIGKLRQVSEFELARYKKNPGEMVRVLAAGSSQLDPQLYAQMRETLQRSPSVQQMMETAEQGKRPSGPEQIELQKQMMQLLKQALAVQKASPAKPSGGGQPAETPRPMNLPREFDAEVADQAGVYAANHGQEELLDYFRQPREFYAAAARKGNSVLLWIA